MIKLLQSNWFAMPLGAMAYLATTALVWPPAHREPAIEGVVPASAKAGLSSNWESQNAETDLLIEELRKEKEELAQRQAEMNSLAERLRVERLELNQVTQTVYQMQMEFDANVVRVREAELTNLKKLGRTYANMDPASVALVFDQMDDLSIVKILALMRDSEVAPILEAMAQSGQADAKRVADISERLRRALPDPADKKQNR